MAVKTWADGDILYSADLNRLPQIVSTNNAGSGVDSTLIPASALSGATYLKFTLTGAGQAYASGDYGKATLKLETKYSGGAYGTDINTEVIGSYKASGYSATISSAQSIVVWHALTANELASGLYFKYTVTIATSTGGTCTYNIGQVIVEKYGGV